MIFEAVIILWEGFSIFWLLIFEGDYARVPNNKEGGMEHTGFSKNLQTLVLINGRVMKNPSLPTNTFEIVMIRRYKRVRNT